MLYRDDGRGPAAPHGRFDQTSGNPQSDEESIQEPSSVRDRQAGRLMNKVERPLRFGPRYGKGNRKEADCPCDGLRKIRAAFG